MGIGIWYAPLAALLASSLEPMLDCTLVQPGGKSGAVEVPRNNETPIKA